MKTKEAIDFKEVAHKIRYWLTFHTNDIDRDSMYEVLEVMDNAIKEGEKYKQSHIKLVEEIERRQGIINELNNYKDMWYDNKCYSKSKKIEELEHKYFPKEIKWKLKKR